jgi:Glycosyltransferase
MFSESAASAQRVYSLCDVCQKLGLLPIIVSCCLDSSSKPPSQYYYYFSESTCSNKKLKNLKFLLGFNGFGTALRYFAARNRIVDVIIYSVCPILSVHFIKRFTRKKSIKLIFDVVEFQDFKSQTFKSFWLYYLGNIYINKIAIKKNANVFAISKYLFRFFKAKGCNVVLLPFINSGNLFLERKGSTSSVAFLYAGFPGKKDQIVSMIRGFNLAASSFKESFVFYLAGPSPKDLFKLGLKNEDYKRSLSYCKYLGPVTLETVKGLYSISDFSVLLKNQKSRRSIADYPSKIVQSLGYGLPVISNLSSDLSECLEDGKNSIIVPDDSEEMFSLSVGRALKMNLAEREAYRTSAYETSKRFFSPETYFTALRGMLE